MSEDARAELAEKFANARAIREAAIDELVNTATCDCYPHGPDEHCTCDGCWACAGRVVGCTCDIAWDCEHPRSGGDDTARTTRNLRGSARGATMTGGEE